MNLSEAHGFESQNRLNILINSDLKLENFPDFDSEFWNRFWMGRLFAKISKFDFDEGQRSGELGCPRYSIENIQKDKYSTLLHNSSSRTSIGIQFWLKMVIGEKRSDIRKLMVSFEYECRIARSI